MPSPATGTIAVNNSGDSWSEGATITLNDGDGGTLVITATDNGASPYATSTWQGNDADAGSTATITDGVLTEVFESVATNGGEPSEEGYIGVWRSTSSLNALINLRSAINATDLQITAGGSGFNVVLTRDVAGVVSQVASLFPEEWGTGWAFDPDSLTHYSGRTVFRIAGRSTAQIAADIAGIINTDSIKISAEVSDDTVILTNDENGSQGNQNILTDSVGDDATISNMSGGFIMADIKPIFFDVTTGGFQSLSGTDNLNLPDGSKVGFDGTYLEMNGSGQLVWDGSVLSTSADITGLKIKSSVVAMADSNIYLGAATDGSTIDGASISNGDRVLLTGQSAGAENGIYVATTATDASTWVRSSDMADDSDPALAFVFVEDGTTYADTGWVCTNNSGVTTIDGIVDVNFAQFSSAGAYTAGDGIDLTGGAFSADVSDFAGTGLEDDGSNNLRIAAAAAGYGLSGGAGSALALDGSELTDEVIASGDSIMFTDATASDGVRVEALDDFSAFLAGAGLGAASGVLAVNVDDSTIEINADALRVKALGVDAAHLAAGAVTDAKLAVDAVTNTKILDGAVSADKIAGQAVTSAKIADGAVGELALADAGVSADKLAEGALQPGNAGVVHLCFQANAGEAITNPIYRPLFVDSADLNEVKLIDDMSVAAEVGAFVGLCADSTVDAATPGAANILRVSGIKITPGVNAINDNSNTTFQNIGVPVYLMDGGKLTTTDGDIASGDYYLQVGVSVSGTEMVTEFGRAPMLKP